MRHLKVVSLRQVLSLLPNETRLERLAIYKHPCLFKNQLFVDGKCLKHLARAYSIKLFTAIINSVSIEAKVFVTVSHFHSSLSFEPTLRVKSHKGLHVSRHSLHCKYQVRVGETLSDKHSCLLRQEITQECKKV